MLVLAMMLGLAQGPQTILVDPTIRDLGPNRLAHLAVLPDALRTLRKSGAKEIRVQVRGVHFLREPIVLGEEASNVRIEGDAVISGGVELRDWRQEKLGTQVVWTHHLDGRRMRQLWDADGNRLVRARSPRKGFHSFSALPPGGLEAPWNTGQDVAFVRPEDLPESANFDDVEVLVHHYWVTSRLPIRSFDRATGRADFKNKSVWRLADDYTGKPASFRVYNSLAHLKEAGDWATSTAQNKVYLVPPVGARLGDFRAYLPALESLFVVKGATNLVMSRLTFQHTEVRQEGSPGDYQAAFNVPGAVILENCKEVKIQNCQMLNLGGYGVEIKGEGSQGNQIERSTLRDLGAGGVKIGSGTSASAVLGCRIEEGGRDHASAVGIWIGDSGKNRIAHNLIRDLFYTGISVGWTWGYAPTRTQDNIIEFNEISDIGQEELSDMGGIYSLGNAKGSVIRNNRIDNVRSRGYGGWGIYFDEGTTEMLAENNVVSRTTTGGFHQHYGKNNTVRNNIFAFAEREGQVIRTRKEDHLSFTFDRNIVVWKGTPLLAGNLDGNFVFTNNLLWRTDEGATPPAGMNDNLVVDPKLGKDFLPDKGSPVYNHGFRPIDLGKVGPKGL